MDIWDYHVELDSDLDLTGYGVEAADGSIGKIDEATYDIGSSYVVVDTGPWIFGRRVMLPAGTIERVDFDREQVHVAHTKDEIKNAPEYDPAIGTDPGPEDLGDYYAGLTRAGRGGF